MRPCSSSLPRQEPTSAPHSTSASFVAAAAAPPSSSLGLASWAAPAMAAPAPAPARRIVETCHAANHQPSTTSVSIASPATTQANDSLESTPHASPMTGEPQVTGPCSYDAGGGYPRAQVQAQAQVQVQAAAAPPMRPQPQQWQGDMLRALDAVDALSMDCLYSTLGGQAGEELPYAQQQGISVKCDPGAMLMPTGPVGPSGLGSGVVYSSAGQPWVSRLDSQQQGPASAASYGGGLSPAVDLHPAPYSPALASFPGQGQAPAALPPQAQSQASLHNSMVHRFEAVAQQRSACNSTPTSTGFADCTTAPGNALAAYFRNLNGQPQQAQAQALSQSHAPVQLLSHAQAQAQMLREQHQAQEGPASGAMSPFTSSVWAQPAFQPAAPAPQLHMPLAVSQPQPRMIYSQAFPQAQLRSQEWQRQPQPLQSSWEFAAMGRLTTQGRSSLAPAAQPQPAEDVSMQEIFAMLRRESYDMLDC
ncbi:hypothetical protein HYH03_017306 [Edaphochlamys debaryana]|uniref:Uncharacterized protein n=1 Tax=Edaphochlamys debaryana TaxID=47281 RepID=A0A835XI62_9CHLO|nr:hypothetical protein HYH03_017306 [Edaphochlamys debaryana]|eukprot:KAG2483854.1 hypothetical protein HYH03_017306 [Edaphochlamys debaryana]